jgi:hypothetical protein
MRDLFDEQKNAMQVGDTNCALELKTVLTNGAG